MRHLVLARTNLDRYLLIVFAVYFFVFLFNSYRLGKLSKPLALILGALGLSSLLALVFLFA